MRNYRDLQVWQKAHELTLDVYVTIRRFPVEEKYGLTSQISACIGVYRRESG